MKSNTAFIFRNGGALEVYNSIITDFAGKAIVIEAAKEPNSFDRYLAGEIIFKNNIFYNFGLDGENANFSDIIDMEGQGNEDVVNAISASNLIEDPKLGSISRDSGLNLHDPRPDSLGIAIQSEPISPIAGISDKIPPYIGAFNCSDYWIYNFWTSLFTAGYLGQIQKCATIDTMKTHVNSVSFAEHSSGLKFLPPFLNPVHSTVNLSFDLPSSTTTQLSIYDINGQLVDQVVLGHLYQGKQAVSLETSDYESGLYIIALKTEYGIVTQKFVVF